MRISKKATAAKSKITAATKAKDKPDPLMSIKRRPQASMKAFLVGAKVVAAEARKANEKVNGLYPSFAVQACFDYGCVIIRKSGGAYVAFKSAFELLQDIIGVTDSSARTKNLFRVLALVDQWAKVNKADAYKKVYAESTPKQLEKMKARAKHNPNKKKESAPFNPMHKPNEQIAKLVGQLYGRAYKYTAMTKGNSASADWLSLSDLLKDIPNKYVPGYDMSVHENE